MSSLRGSFDPLTGIIVRIGIAKPNSFPSQQTGPVPHIVKVQALLDTGASRTSIKATIAERVGLPIRGKWLVQSIHGTQPTNWYDGDVVLYFEEPHGQSYVASEIRLVELAITSAFDALLGRDVLCRCDFQMTKAHEFVLSI